MRLGLSPASFSNIEVSQFRNSLQLRPNGYQVYVLSLTPNQKTLNPTLRIHCSLAAEVNHHKFLHFLSIPLSWKRSSLQLGNPGHRQPLE